MSMIVDMVLLLEYTDNEAMQRLNAWCQAEDVRYAEFGGQQFERLDLDIAAGWTFQKVSTEEAGGAKVFTGEVWAMSGNYFPYGSLITALPSFGWRIPAAVVLAVSAEDDEGMGWQLFRAAPRREPGGYR